MSLSIGFEFVCSISIQRDAVKAFYGESSLPERSNIRSKTIVSVLGFWINSPRQLSRLELRTSSSTEGTLRKTYSGTTCFSEPSFHSSLTHGTAV